MLTADIIVYVCCSIYADYYLEIKKPISLMKIQKKLKVCMYRDYACEGWLTIACPCSTAEACIVCWTQTPSGQCSVLIGCC